MRPLVKLALVIVVVLASLTFALVVPDSLGSVTRLAIAFIGLVAGALAIRFYFPKSTRPRPDAQPRPGPIEAPPAPARASQAPARASQAPAPAPPAPAAVPAKPAAAPEPPAPLAPPPPAPAQTPAGDLITQLETSFPSGDWTRSNAPYATVRVLFATDRNHNPGAPPADLFGTSRAPLSYGTCDVSVPRDHRMGQLESPSLFRLQFREDPEKHVVLLRAKLLPKDDFLRTLAERVNTSPRRNAFLFVHGYNVTFEDAARRTAQIAYDLAFDGAPVFYSWPSRGSKPAYTIDEQNIEWAQANLQIFLTDFFEKSQAEHIYLIAHSMGNRALTRAVAAVLAERPEFRPRLEEIILAAPDIDAEVFKRDIAPRLTAAGRPVTLYASSDDLALSLSEGAHGYPRAGDSGPSLVIVPGIETIDATGVDSSFLAHSYFAETTSILSDIYYLIKQGVRASQRFGLTPVHSPAGLYWKIRR